jgi:hypothetical protein
MGYWKKKVARKEKVEIDVIFSSSNLVLLMHFYVIVALSCIMIILKFNIHSLGFLFALSRKLFKHLELEFLR